MRRWFKRRPRGEVRLFAQVIAALVFTRVALSCLPLPSVRRRVWRALSADRHLPELDRLPMVRVLRVAEAASRFVPVGATCLARALVVQALLHRHGYSAQLRIGVRRPASGPFAAHAWLEQGGVVVVGGPADVVAQYQALPAVEQLIA